MQALSLEMPYPLIDIAGSGEHFRFLCTEIRPEYRTPEQEKPTDFHCKFGVEYEGRGISARFDCDITAGNVYAFYMSLDDAYDALDWKEIRTAQLENYGTLHRTSMRIRFDKRGHCIIDGSFLNPGSAYQSGITLHMEVDFTCGTDIISKCRYFFRQLTEAQGHSNFY